MAQAPLNLADVQQGSALTENWGRPTPYFKRWLDDNNRRITASIVGIQTALDEIAAQQLILEDQQEQLTLIVSDLSDQQDALAELIYATTGTAGITYTPTDSSGFVSIAHGYSNATYPPASAFSAVGPFGISPVFHIQDVAVNSTNIMFYCFDMSGAPLASTNIAVLWHVAGA